MTFPASRPVSQRPACRSWRRLLAFWIIGILVFGGLPGILPGGQSQAGASVEPRVQIMEEGMPPIVDEERRLFIVAWAAMDAPTSNCQDTHGKTCTVKEVRYFGREIGTTGTNQPWITVLIPSSGPFAEADEWWFDYSPPTSIQVPLDVDLHHLEVKAEAVVETDGGSTTSATGWVKVLTPPSQAALEFRYPESDGHVFGRNTANVSIAYTKPGAEEPELAYDIIHLHSGDLVSADVSDDWEGESGEWIYKWHTTPLGPGEYQLNVSLIERSGKVNSTRMFFVEPQPPTLQFLPVANSAYEDEGGKLWVAPTFEMHAKITHGFADIFRVEPTLGLGTTQNDQVLLNPGAGGFDVEHQIEEQHKGVTTFRYTITMPDAPSHSRFDLRVKVTTNAMDDMEEPHVGSASQVVFLDATPPEKPGTFLMASMEAVNNQNFVGHAIDRESGIGKIEVRLYDPGRNVTFIGSGPTPGSHHSRHLSSF